MIYPPFSFPVLSDNYRTAFSRYLITPQPVVAGLFLKCLAFIYASAFLSMAVQIQGLIGSNGILPVETLLRTAEIRFPQAYYRYFPTVFWFDADDTTLTLVCYLGAVAATLVFFNCLTRTALLVCYLFYLSIFVAGQDFTGFQWDTLLLEAGFLAILLPRGYGIIVLLYRWLIARFMFMGGLVKIASGDPTWANFTALNYHYQTQPLPQALAWHLHHWPEWFHRLCVGGVFFIELIAPLMVFMPRRLRFFAACAFIALQLTIILTGNYTFFNLLTIALCLFLFDDRALANYFPNRLIERIKLPSESQSKTVLVSSALFAVVVFTVCASRIHTDLTGEAAYSPLRTLVRTVSTLALVNNYGPFAVMTTVRREIIIQGSNDGIHWQNYQFKYKPDRLDKPLRWNLPHQPRLDWQMWFQSFSATVFPQSWFERFLQRLQHGSPSVTALLTMNPFPNRPPKHLRAMIYRYRYTSPAQRAATGQIWRRDLGRIYWRQRGSTLHRANRSQRK